MFLGSDPMICTGFLQRLSFIITILTNRSFDTGLNPKNMESESLCIVSLAYLLENVVFTFELAGVIWVVCKTTPSPWAFLLPAMVLWFCLGVAKSKSKPNMPAAVLMVSKTNTDATCQLYMIIICCCQCLHFETFTKHKQLVWCWRSCHVWFGVSTSAWLTDWLTVFMQPIIAEPTYHSIFTRLDSCIVNKVRNWEAAGPPQWCFCNWIKYFVKSQL